MDGFTCQFIAKVRPVPGGGSNGLVEDGEVGPCYCYATVGWILRACTRLNMTSVHYIFRFIVTRCYDSR